MDIQTTPRRVLVVDDEALIRWSVAESLSVHGFQVVESADAQSARSAMRDALRAGAYCVLDKPFELDDLADVVSAATATDSPAPGDGLFRAAVN